MSSVVDIRCVCGRHKTGDPNSPWRDRPIAENLREFENMRMGLYAKGTFSCIAPACSESHECLDAHKSVLFAVSSHLVCVVPLLSQAPQPCE